ncbi:hypothetical protein T484DRAFT_3201668 [Baffinella frigidus]|nr:hypothetical protein T484DRAFT_3201668 [Cryptophyta sp. CCMP2293]
MGAPLSHHCVSCAASSLIPLTSPFAPKGNYTTLSSENPRHHHSTPHLDMREQQSPLLFSHDTSSVRVAIHNVPATTTPPRSRRMHPRQTPYTSSQPEHPTPTTSRPVSVCPSKHYREQTPPTVLRIPTSSRPRRSLAH